MAEQEPVAEKKSSAILKFLLSTFAGLASGAVLMYLSPLVNSAIKPPKPLPNFAYQAEGLKVTFLNRSTGAHDGWWDFGDDSGLQPFSPDRDKIVHQFRKPGVYSVKLALKNILGEETERTVTVNLERDEMADPEIVQFNVERRTAPSMLPASFHVSAEVRNADLCIWSFGEERPLEIVTEPRNKLRKWVTFKQPGTKMIRLVVANGKQTREKVEKIVIDPIAPSAAPALASTQPSAMVAIQWTYGATPEPQVETWTFDVPLSGAGGAFETPRKSAPPGYRIIKTEVIPNKLLRDARANVSSDQTSVSLKGEGQRSSFGAFRNGPTSTTVQIRVWLDRKTMAREVTREMYSMLKIPGETRLDLPQLDPGWRAEWARIDLKILDDRKQVLFGSQTQLPQNARINVGGRELLVTGVQEAGQLRFVVQPAQIAAPAPPLLPPRGS
jgi:hypothetical protein